MNTLTPAAMELAVQRAFDYVEEHARQRESFEYLDDPAELVERRGTLSAMAVA